MWTARRTPSKWRTNSKGAGAATGDGAIGDRSSDAGSPDHDLSDERLLERLRRREPAALAILHDNYSGGIYNLALRMVGNSQDAEDVTQDVLLRAFEHLPRDRSVNLRPWLYRITINRCYDLLRTTARRPAPDTGLATEVPARIDTFAQAELEHLFERSLAALTPRQRAAMLLKDVHGLSLDEAATALHITPGSVEVLLARARNSFRARFTELCQRDGRPEASWSILTALPVMLSQHPLPSALQAPPAVLGGAPLPVNVVPPVTLTGPPVAAPLLPPVLTTGFVAALSGSVSAKLAVVMLAAGVAATSAGIGLPTAPPPATHKSVAHVAAPHIAAKSTLNTPPSPRAKLAMSRIPVTRITVLPTPVTASVVTTSVVVPTDATTATVTAATAAISPRPSPARVNGASPPRAHEKSLSDPRVQQAMNRLGAGRTAATAVLRQLARDDEIPPGLLRRLAASGRLPRSVVKRLATRELLPLSTVRRPANSGATTSTPAGGAPTPAPVPFPAPSTSAALTPSSTP